ncbi:hypothetical protein BOX15_Mlig008204g3 [Macrostomum lignano]|uniref:Uncharacterized protein n=2 Tax=Macrostomum lignano TaxID=282301 RepID=A0A267FN14_9PLAT|nr:hypothetical protein BOX15_Mlig008204g2 [Macrostomum lignano]PAA74372.1 hypothetical protein BOX15_Mlig008204g3 [Macrostomum lignano]
MRSMSLSVSPAHSTASASGSTSPAPPPLSPGRVAAEEAAAQNPFLDAFFAVDKDRSESITPDELAAYMTSSSQFEANFGEKWMKLFDENDDGAITLDEYCNVLGLNPKQARIYRLNQLKAECLRNNRLPEDVTVIASSMGLEMQVDLTEIFRDAQRRGKDEKDVAGRLKQQLDGQFGKLWHVVMVTGQYWASYSHEPGLSFFFKIGRHIVMCWKTPDV